MRIKDFIKRLKNKHTGHSIVYTIFTHEAFENVYAPKWNSYATYANAVFPWFNTKADMIMFAYDANPKLLNPQYFTNAGPNPTDFNLFSFLEKYYSPDQHIIHHIFTREDFLMISDSAWPEFCEIINKDFPTEGIVHEIQHFTKHTKPDLYNKS